MSASVIRWVTIKGFLGTIVPVVASLMMALRLQKSLLKRLFVGTILKGVLIVPFTWVLGFRGTIIATIVSYLYMFFLNLNEIGRRYKINFMPTAQVFVKTAAGLAAMTVSCGLFSMLGLGNTDAGRIMCFMTTVVNGLLSTIVFAAVVLYLQVPQYLFHFKLQNPKRKA